MVVPWCHEEDVDFRDYPDDFALGNFVEASRKSTCYRLGLDVAGRMCCVRNEDLITEDLADGENYEGVLVVNPFQ